MTRRTMFREADLARALKVVQGAGVAVGRVEIDADGRIAVIARTLTEVETDTRDAAQASLDALRDRLKSSGGSNTGRKRGRPRKTPDAA